MAYLQGGGPRNRRCCPCTGLDWTSNIGLARQRVGKYVAYRVIWIPRYASPEVIKK